MSRQIQVIIAQSEIEAKIAQLAQTITADYQGKNLLLIGILKGCVPFIGDLARALWHAGLHDFEIDYMGISSYGSDTESSKNPRITKDLDTNIQHRHALIVEDIIDTGHSLNTLTKILKQRSPASLKTMVLLDKPTRRQVSIQIDYLGFTVSGWVEGYGLDTAELFRGRPDVVEVIQDNS